MRVILLFVIGLIFGAAGGFLAAGGLGNDGHDHAGHGDEGHDHSVLVAWEGAAPGLELVLSPDTGAAHNLHILTTGFTFAPEQVNGRNAPGTGHAHIYVNGAKIMRAYGAWVHLDDVKTGDIVRVTLNTNDHSGWGVDGTPLAAEVTVP